MRLDKQKKQKTTRKTPDFQQPIRTSSPSAHPKPARHSQPTRLCQPGEVFGLEPELAVEVDEVSAVEAQMTGAVQRWLFWGGGSTRVLVVFMFFIVLLGFCFSSVFWWLFYISFFVGVFVGGFYVVLWWLFVCSIRHFDESQVGNAWTRRQPIILNSQVGLLGGDICSSKILKNKRQRKTYRNISFNGTSLKF